MTDSFNHVYGKHDDPFYYGLKPSKKLEKFLNDTHPPTGEALDLGCGEGRNSLLLARYGFHVHAIDASSQGIQKLEQYAGREVGGHGDLQEEVARREEVRMALASLNTDQRRVIALRYGADLTEVDIAQVLGWPVGTVKSRLNRARESLRTLLLDERG